MDFNNPQVRQRVSNHIMFAISAVSAAIPDILEDATQGSDVEVMRQMANNLRNPIIMQLLSFTLNLDFKLKNTLSGTDMGLEE